MKALWNAFVSGAVKPGDPIAETAPNDAAVPLRIVPEAPPAAAPPAPAVAAEAPSPAPAVAPPADDPSATAAAPTPQGVLTVDRAGAIQAIDLAGAALFGYTPPELLGREVRLLIPHGLPGAMDHSELLANGPQDQWVIGCAKGGARFPLQCIALATNSKSDRLLTVVLRRAPGLDEGGEVPALVSGWQQLEQELTAAQQARQATQTELTAAQQARRAAQTELAAAQTQNQRLQQSLSERAAQAAELANSEVEAAHAAVETATARWQHLTGEWEQLQQEKAAGDAQRADLESRLRAVTATARELEQTLAARSLAETSPAAEAQADQLRPALAEAEAQRAEALAKEEVERAQAKVAAQALEAAQAELADYRRRLDDQSASLSQARQTAAELRSRVASMTGNLAEVQAQLAIAQEQAKDSTEQAQGLAGELNFVRERAQRSQQESKSISQATEEVIREVAASRVALAALQHERDTWKTRGEQACAEAAASVAAAVRWEREGGAATAQCQALEQQLAELRQLETERRQAVETAEARLAKQTKVLTAIQREKASHEAERNRLTEELQQQLLGRTRAEHEAKALAATTTEVSREIAGARVVLATLQHERDDWKARSEESRAQAEAGAAAAVKAETESASVAARCQMLEQQLVEHRQRETEWRQAAEAAELQFAERSRALAAIQREQEGREAEQQRMTAELQKEMQRRTRAESEAQASAETTKDISRELASARVVLETLRQERDLWQAQSTQAQTDSNEALAKLAAAEERQRQLEQATDSVCSSLRRTLELTTTEMAPLVSALQTALARHGEAKGRLTQAQSDPDQAPSPFAIPHFHRDT